ncbi:hypothetical protein KSP40_PGU002924 [Platanthera guangdongensis]|uniref:Uncharacterized protein n=1 Tax=Platanthera guangdongensis TaxID=2320717 RepID=A0ABR2LLC3_9ASPA
MSKLREGGVAGCEELCNLAARSLGKKRDIELKCLEVITTFVNVGDDELSLLGVEELESDFEAGPEKKEKRKRDVKVDSLGYESEKEKKMKYKKQEKELLKKIRSEKKKERKALPPAADSDHLQLAFDQRNKKANTLKLQKSASN